MTYDGHVERGVVILDEPTALTDGTKVRIEVVAVPREGRTGGRQSLVERLASVIGKAEGLPADWSERHDAYLRDQHQG